MNLTDICIDINSPSYEECVKCPEYIRDYMIWWYEHTFSLPTLLLTKTTGWFRAQLHRRMMFANQAKYIKCKHNK